MASLAISTGGFPRAVVALSESDSTPAQPSPEGEEAVRAAVNTATNCSKTQAGEIEESFVYNPPEELRCPICFELMEKPVITRECAHSFCKSCLDKSCSLDKSQCPTCRATIDVSTCHRNHLLTSIIEKLPVHCRYKESGCAAIVPRHERSSHEMNCQFGNRWCPHRKHGCKFFGRKKDLSQHLQNCSYEALKDLIASRDREIASLQKKVEQQRIDITNIRGLLELVVEHLQDENNTKEPGRQFSLSLHERSLLDRGDTTSQSIHAVENVLKSPARVTCVRTLNEHEDSVEALAVYGDFVLSAAWDGTVKMWKAGSSKSKATMRCSSDVRALMVYDSLMFTGGGSGIIETWDLHDQKKICRSQNHTNDVLCLEMVDGKVWSGSADNSIKIFATESMVCLHTLGEDVGHKNWVFSLKKSQRSGTVFSGSSDCEIKVWDVGTLSAITSLEGHSDQIRTLSINNQLLISGGYDRTVKLWDERVVGGCVHTMDVGNEVFGLESFQDHGLFVGVDVGDIQVWDVRSIRRLGKISAHEGSIYSFASHETGLYTAAADTLVKVWA